MSCNHCISQEEYYYEKTIHEHPKPWKYKSKVITKYKGTPFIHSDIKDANGNTVIGSPQEKHRTIFPTIVNAVNTYVPPKEKEKEGKQND